MKLFKWSRNELLGLLLMGIGLYFVRTTWGQDYFVPAIFGFIIMMYGSYFMYDADNT